MKAKAVLSIFFTALLVAASLSATEVSGASIEVIVNGGFETGDDTGWTGRYYEVTSDFVHSGLYSLQIWSSDGGVWQDLTEPISSAYIKNFGFWHRKISDYGVSLIYAVVNYDSSEPIFCDAVESTVDWQYYDIMPYIPADTQIKSIMIWTASVWGEGWEGVCVDDVSLLAETQTQQDEGGVPIPYPPPPPQNESQNGGDWAGGFVQFVGTLKEIVQRLLGNPLYLLLLLLMVAVLAYYSTRKRPRR
jgi:hypothetical protein